MTRRLGTMQRAVGALALLTCMEAAGRAQAQQPATADAGQAEYDRHDLEAARRIWESAALSGDRLAAFDLGLLYDLGEGVPQEPARAYQWFMEAAAAGLPQAEFNVAVMRDSGRGVARDLAKAADWYGRAAANGHARAAYNLAQLYAAGQGVPRNLDQAALWYEAAAAGGIQAARHPAGRRAPQATVTNQPLLGAMLVAPTRLRLRDARLTAELVWLAPGQPRLTRFFVTVLARDLNGLHEVVARATDLSAMLVELPPGQEYVWRVYTIADGSPHYAASTWGQFASTGSGL